MLRLRPYKRTDADIIAGWIKDEVTFRKWCALEYESYPITGEDINRYYDESYEFHDDLYEFTAFDEDGPVGHFTLRLADEKKTVAKLGFVLVDGEKRGRGYGREMLKLAMKYAFELLKAERMTLLVFENNVNAYGLYSSMGFRVVEGVDKSLKFFGERWRGVEMEAFPR